MNKINSKIRKVYNQIRGFFPEALPVGLTHFHVWADTLLDCYNLKSVANEDDLKYVLATSIMHLGAQDAYKPKWFFVKTIRKAAANQVSSAVFQDIKQKQQAKAEESATAKVATSDGPKTVQ